SKVPANVQTVDAPAFDHAKTPSLTDAMVRSLPGVSLGDQTGNPFQPDINYRGFTASPVIGTPQGLAIYQNGTRINEVFGDTINWDFIPQMAINRMTLAPNNPVYGLNAVGGALTLDMKNGFNYQGIEGELRGGSFGRLGGAAQAGWQKDNLAAYVALDGVREDGCRDFSSFSRLSVFLAPQRKFGGPGGARGEDGVPRQLPGRQKRAGLGRRAPGRDAHPALAGRLPLAAGSAQPPRLPAGERHVQADRHVLAPGQCLLSRVLAEPSRRQHHRRAAVRSARRSLLRRQYDAAARLLGRSGPGHIRPQSGPTRPHLDHGQQLRRLAPGHQHVADRRPRQSPRGRRQRRPRPGAVHRQQRARHHRPEPFRDRDRRADPAAGPGSGAGQP